MGEHSISALTLMCPSIRMGKARWYLSCVWLGMARPSDVCEHIVPWLCR
jgi:hypothetical protein